MASSAAAAVVHSNDSKSLWNYTLSPGWTEKEVEVFRIALMKFGVGRWTKIVESRCLPGKTVAQLNLQAQRMIGQQSTSEFTGLNVDPSKVFAANSLREGMRKNGCLINMEGNPDQEVIKRKKAANKRLYGLSQEEIDALVIPVLRQEDTSTVVIKSTLNLKDKANRRREKYDQLRELQAQLERIRAEIAARESGVAAKPKLGSKPAKPAAKKAAATKKKGNRGRHKTLSDSELARRLQQEEEGLNASSSSDDSDFEVKPTRSGRMTKRRKRYPA